MDFEINARPFTIVAEHELIPIDSAKPTKHMSQLDLDDALEALVKVETNHATYHAGPLLVIRAYLMAQKHEQMAALAESLHVSYERNR
jgi:hypothetical protein